MKITVEFRNDLLIVWVSGRLDSSNVLDFVAAVRSAASGRERPIIIECRELSFLSSAGLRAILLIARSQRAVGEGFAVCSMQPPVARAFRTSGFHRIVSAHGSLEEALKAVEVRMELQQGRT